MSEETDTPDAEESAPPSSRLDARTGDVVYFGEGDDRLNKYNVEFGALMEATSYAAAGGAAAVAAVREAGKTVRTAMQEKTKRQAIEAGRDGGPEPQAAEQVPDTD